MNNLQYGFFDELSKIAADEMKGVRPEVAKEIANKVRQSDYVPYQANRWQTFDPKELSPSEIRKNIPGHGAVDPKTHTVFRYRNGLHEVLSKVKPADLEKHRNLREAQITNIKTRLNQSIADKSKALYDSGQVDTSHLPGFGRRDPGYKATLPDGAGNPWGRALPPRAKMPPMPTPVNR